MEETLKEALTEYALHIMQFGWEDGEEIIRKWERKISDFRRWAYAVGIMRRAEEILEERGYANDGDAD